MYTQYCIGAIALSLVGQLDPVFSDDKINIFIN